MSAFEVGRIDARYRFGLWSCKARISPPGRNVLHARALFRNADDVCSWATRLMDETGTRSWVRTSTSKGRAYGLVVDRETEATS